MKIFFYTVGLGLLLTACGGQSAQTNQVADSTITDTVAAMPPNLDIDVNALLARFILSTSLPFVQDSAYLEDIGMNDSMELTADQVRFLSYNFIENDLSYSGKSRIDDVLFFDSLKSNDSYEGYVEVLDIGMMEKATAYIAEKIVLDDSTDLLLWYVDFSTYEACPYAAGRNLYASVFRNNTVKSCTVIGENSGSSDAPYWSETLILFSAENGKMQVSKTDRNGGDTDEEGNDIASEYTTIYSLEIINGNWQVTEQAVPVE